MIPEVPSYLGDDYVGNELVLDDKGGVKAGTLRALVVRLTQHGTAGESLLALLTGPSLNRWREAGAYQP